MRLGGFASVARIKSLWGSRIWLAGCDAVEEAVEAASHRLGAALSGEGDELNLRNVADWTQIE